MRNWKTVAGFAGAGVVLSLLLGLAAGNPLGVMLLRMLLSGIGAGALGFGLRVVIERFLPELGSAGDGRLSGGQGPGSQGRVNIVLPAENPHEPAGYAAASEGELPAGGMDEAELEGDSMEPDRESEGSLGLSAAAVDILEAEAADVETLGAEESGEHGSEEVGVQRPTRGRGGLDTLGGTNQDPEIVARAVRTMLKRDQEG